MKRGQPERTAYAEPSARHSASIQDIARRPIWTVSEAALVLSCSVNTVRQELRRGAIFGIHIAREWRIPAGQFGVPLVGPGSPEYAPSGLLTSGDPFSSPLNVGPPAPHRLEFEGAPWGLRQHSGPTLSIYLFGHARLYIDQARVGILERGNRRSEIIQLLALHRAGLSGPQLASLLKMVNQQYEDGRLDPHYVRTLIWSTRNDARKQTGWDGIIQSPVRAGRGAHHYHLPNDTRCDLWDFEDKLDRADQLVARAVALANRAYGGSPTDRAGRECRAGGRMRGVLPGGYGDIGDAEPVGSVRDIVDTGDASGPAPLGKGREDARVEAAMLREEALELYRGEFCADSTLGCLVDAARALEERYLRSALQQADFWRTVALSQAPRPVASHRAAPRGAALHVEQRGRYALSAPDRAVELGQPSRQAPMQTEWDARAVWREAQRNYERVLMTDPYHEVACIHCMQCCAALGDARGVGITFERYRDVLHEDLSQAPSMRVERAYQEFAP